MPPRRLGLALACLAALPAWVVLGAGALDALPPEGAQRLAAESLLTAGALALIAIAGAALSRDPIAPRLGLGRGRLPAGRAALAVVGLVGLSHALEATLRVTGFDASVTLARFEQALSGTGLPALLFPLAVFALAVPLAEELLFRGLVQRGFERPLGAPAAIGLAALAFGAAHVDVVQGSAAVLLGLYLGSLAWAGDSIRLPIVAHAVNNAAAVAEAAAGLRVPSHGAAPWLSIAFGLAVAVAGLRAAGIPTRRSAPS